METLPTGPSANLALTLVWFALAGGTAAVAAMICSRLAEEFAWFRNLEPRYRGDIFIGLAVVLGICSVVLKHVLYPTGPVTIEELWGAAFIAGISAVSSEWYHVNVTLAKQAIKKAVEGAGR